MKRVAWIVAMIAITVAMMGRAGTAEAREAAAPRRVCEPVHCVTINGCSIQCAHCDWDTEDGGTCQWP